MKDKKKHSSITLTIKGDKITADKLRNSIGAFYGFVDEVASQVSGREKAIKWIVTVKKGSIMLVNEPEFAQDVNTSVTPTIYKYIKEGIDMLEAKTERPTNFTDRALEYLSDLASIPSGRSNGLTGIGITIDEVSHNLTSHVSANVETILGIYTKGLGSVEGKLETISERGGLKFIIYDSLSDRPVRCNIGEDLIYEATKAFGKRVYVFGMISYDQYGIPKSIKVNDFKEFEQREKLPSALEVCGILGEANAIGI